MVFTPLAGDDPFAEPAIATVPADWVAALPGRLMVAAHVGLVRAAAPPDLDAISERLFAGNVLAGGQVSGGMAHAFTDFRIHNVGPAGGFSRILVQDHGMAPRQAGRVVQRLLEIDTYRMLALLALPLAREIGPFLTRSEQELARVTNALVQAGEHDEPDLLERLTRLAAEVESREAESLYRFSAADAYYELVQRRIAELREVRIEGVQTLQEFTERRLAPAMNTCRAVAARQESAVPPRGPGDGAALHPGGPNARAAEPGSARLDEPAGAAAAEAAGDGGGAVDRGGDLLRRRAGRLRGEGHQGRWGKIDPDLVTGIAIPVVAVVVALGLRQVRRFLKRRRKSRAGE
ncbi:DUF3422 family protein [Dankookia sp. P2]|uniref:DUF3422 family protein n=1 Tax=Dankookia sp. P2 TaxID=3423955 RepID=UPI003D67D5AE